MIDGKSLFAEISNESVCEDGEVVGYFVKNSRMNELELLLAPPAPVAVPDVGEFRIFTQAGGVKVAVKDGKTKNHLFGMGWNACRAAMLKAGPVTGWIKCSERMPADRDSVLLWDADLDDALSGHYSHQTGNFYQAGMVVDNEITHWMPLPAAPEQEV